MRYPSLLLIVLSLAPAAAEEPCPPEARQFDFWVGEWDVHAAGALAGRNRIEPILDGCVLQETWSGARGSAGSSLNFYNPEEQAWEQFWVWKNGTTLHLTGGLVRGAMVLGNETNRITWTPNADGTVRQHWQVRESPEAAWTDAFDGLYRKEAKAACVARVLARDNELGKARNHAPETAPLAEAVARYVEGLDGLDFTGCPPAFAAAFSRHRDAWKESAPFFEDFAGLRGEMHDLFDEIRSRDEPGKRLRALEDRIWGTWAEVEEAAGN